MPFVRDDGLGGERTEPTSLFKRITTLRGRVSVRRVRPSQYHVCVQELTIRAPLIEGWSEISFSFLREKRHHPDGTEAIVMTSPKTTIDWHVLSIYPMSSLYDYFYVTRRPLKKCQ